MKSKAFESGKKCKRLGKSIHYNPYRNKGTATEFVEWELGWQSYEPSYDLPGD